MQPGAPEAQVNPNPALFKVEAGGQRMPGSEANGELGTANRDVKAKGFNLIPGAHRTYGREVLPQQQPSKRKECAIIH